jgi:tetratricopeptide (TPR) repeat protein
MRWISALAAVVLAAFLSLWFLRDAASPVQANSGTGAAFADQLGRVDFPTSCSSRVQPTIEKGVALLHSFQYQQTKQVFTEAATQEPTCAMAEWGEAMSLYHQLWDFPDDETLAEGRRYIDQAQKSAELAPRERAYLGAAAAFYQDNSKLDHAARWRAYLAAMEKLHQDFPGDAEGAEFYALSLISNPADAGIDLANREKAISILDLLFHAEPNNPGAAHYLIHATDTPDLAPKGLDAARAYAKIAPDSSHALHMPSHIFVRLGLWQETIDSNIAASASAARATEMHLSDPHYQIHALDFLDYAYIQTGQETKARQLVEDLHGVPGMADMKNMADEMAYFAARNALELHHWKEAAALPVPDVKLAWQDTTYRARAIGAARIGDVEGARKATAKLAEAVAARAEDDKKKGYYVPEDENIGLSEAKGWLAYAEGKTDEAVQILRSAADRQKAKGVDSIAIPAREMLADLLFELKRPAEAADEYKMALKNSPDRFDSLYGAARAAQLAGNTADAQTYYAKLVEISVPTADRQELQEARVFIAKK